jgi:hypothetical protein
MTSNQGATTQEVPADGTQSYLVAGALIDLTEAAACFADARGRKPHVATLRRWASHGCRGHKLETTYLGNRLMTTAQAAARFLAAINSRPVPKPAAGTSAAEKAGQELKALLK